jgi:hypothetical protein
MLASASSGGSGARLVCAEALRNSAANNNKIPIRTGGHIALDNSARQRYNFKK